MTEWTEGYGATLAHIARLREKRVLLKTAQMEAERQHLQRLSCAAGGLDLDELAGAYQEYKDSAGDGHSARWDEVMPVSAASMRYRLRFGPRYRANGPAGTWQGVHPLPFGDPRPPPGTCVVYVLYDAANDPCYVGSTGDFRVRVNAHYRDGKSFARWTAYPCADREGAYALEDRLLKQHKPYLNRKAAA